MSGHAPPEVPRRVFEGLFAGPGCALTPALTAELLAVGYDAGRPEAGYTLEQWRAAIELTRRHLLPDLAPELGLETLGRRFSEGFGQTTVGRVFRYAAPIFGVDRTLLSIPRYLYTVRRTMKVEVVQESERRFRVLLDDQGPNPRFIAGCLLGILDIFRIDGRAAIEREEGAHFEIVLSWGPPG